MPTEPVGQREPSFIHTPNWLATGMESSPRIIRSQRRTIDSDARDAQNSPTTVLRSGLLMGLVTATGKLKEYDPDAIDGTESVYGVLEHEVRLTDESDVATDRWTTIVVGATVKPAGLLVKGVSLVGHVSAAAIRLEMKDSPLSFRFVDEY